MTISSSNFKRVLHMHLTSIMRAAQVLFESGDSTEAWTSLNSLLTNLCPYNIAIMSSREGETRENEVSPRNYDWRALLRNAGIYTPVFEEFLKSLSVYYETGKENQGLLIPEQIPEQVIHFLSALKNFYELKNSIGLNRQYLMRIPHAVNLEVDIGDNMSKAGLPLNFLDPRDPSPESTEARLLAYHIVNVLLHRRDSCYIVNGHGGAKQPLGKDGVVQLVGQLQGKIENAGHHEIEYGLKVFIRAAKAITQTSKKALQPELLEFLINVLQGTCKVGRVVLEFNEGAGAQNAPPQERVLDTFESREKALAMWSKLVMGIAAAATSGVIVPRTVAGHTIGKSKGVGATSLVDIFVRAAGRGGRHEIVLVIDGHISKGGVDAITDVYGPLERQGDCAMSLN